MKSGIRRALPGSAIALMLAVTLAACGTTADEADPTVTRIAVEGAPPARTPTLPADATPPPGNSDATPPVGGDGGGELATTVELTLVDTAFEPTELTIPADTDVTFNLTNDGVLPHAFEVTDQDIASDEIAGGGTGSVTVNLPAGDYPFICPVPGHADAGMVGILHVQTGAGDDVASPADTGGAGGHSGSGTAGATTVDLSMIELAFEPADFTIAANTDVTLNLINNGVLPHAFQLEDGSVESDEIAGGGTGSVVLNLSPGSYPYICPVPGHAEGGMVGTITVE